MLANVSRRAWLRLAGSAIVAGGVAGPGSLAAEDAIREAKLRVSAAVRAEMRVLKLRPIPGGHDRVVVTAMAAAPNGELLAVAGDDHAVRIMTVPELRTLQTLRAHRDRIRTLDFDGSGNRFVSAGNDGELILWRRQDGQYREVQTMTGSPALACVQFSPDDDELAAVGFDRRVFRISDRKRAPWETDTSDLRAVAYRDDRRQLVTGGRSGELCLFETAGSQPLGRHRVHRGPVRAIVFPPSSNIAVTVGEDGFVSLFDTERGALVARNRITTGKLFSIAMVDSHRAAVAGSDNDIRVISTETGNVEHVLEGHQGSVAALASAGGHLFSGGYDATVRRWAVRNLIGESQRIAEGKSASAVD